jgi:hypothetical protein
VGEFWILDFGFWILENCPTPHFKIDRPLAKVNRWTGQQTEAYLAEVWQIWGERSQHSWKLDLSWLEQEFGIKVEEKR